MSEFLKPSGATVASGTIKQPISKNIINWDGFSVSGNSYAHVLIGTTGRTLYDTSWIEISDPHGTIFKALKDGLYNFTYNFSPASNSLFYVVKNNPTTSNSLDSESLVCVSNSTTYHNASFSIYLKANEYVKFISSVGSFTATATSSNNIFVSVTSYEESAPNFTVSLPVSKDNNKTYTEAQTGSITGSSGTWTTISAKFSPYRTISKTTNLPVWRMAFTISGNVPSASRGNYTISIPGVLFPSGFNVPINGTSNTYMQSETYTVSNTNTVYINHQSATTTRYDVSGDVELTAKPTWADDWNEPGCYVGNVPREQVAIVQYRGNGSRTTLSTTPVAMPLTTIKGDTSIVSIASNQFTLQAGEYDIDIDAYLSHADNQGWAYGYLYSVSDGVEIDRTIPTTGSTSGDTSYSRLLARLSIPSIKIYEVRFISSGTGTHYLGSTNTSPNDLNGFIKIRKLA